MILATSNDYEFPHIDWMCRECGEVYCYAGYPPETRCTQGHGAGWMPRDDQIGEYIELLQSLEVGDGVVICAHGPAPLMAPVESVGESCIVTEAIDSPSRTIRWSGGDQTIEMKKTDAEFDIYDDVYHVETVEVLR